MTCNLSIRKLALINFFYSEEYIYQICFYKAIFRAKNTQYIGILDISIELL